jgi:adenylosuccinate lyase
MNPDYTVYLSPFSWRYGSQGMRQLWSEVYKRRLWRQIWVALAQVQSEFGLLRPEQVQDLRAHMDDVDIPQALEIETAIGHDLMAELKTFASQSLSGGGSLHLGATSTDIEDNADAFRLRQSFDLLIDSLSRLLGILAEKIDAWADFTLMGYTHLQPAEPTTLGYRLALYAQDLLMDWEALRRSRAHVRGKGFKGAVGTGASYAELLSSDALAEFETRLSTLLGLPFFPVTAQTYPRKQDYQVIASLAGLGSSLYKLAFDLRFLQSPSIGELSEPFGRQQVGSSAMPFKRNPIQAEKIDSLARYLAQMPRLAWDNAAHSILERTLDDSANRRSLLPEAFLTADELLITAERIVDGLQINQAAIGRNLAAYAPFAATERVLMALVKAGADRQAMHERLRQHSLAAWEAVESGQANPLTLALCRDPELLRYLSSEQITGLMDASRYVGNAPQRARLLAQDIRSALERAETA